MKENFMKRKSLIGLLAMALVIGMLVIGCEDAETPPDPCADGHDFSDGWEKDADWHWKECERDGCEAVSGDGTAESGKAAHEGIPCEVCDYLAAYDVIIDLAIGEGVINNDTHPTSAGQTVLIKGISNGKRWITITNATEIYIANNTEIKDVINVPGGTIHGGGSGIIIADIGAYGSIEISGVIGTTGLIWAAAGDITISGTIGSITGDTDGEVSIGADAGDITISGTVGDITGLIYTDAGDITISGTVGDITSMEYGGGIWTFGSITISGTVGNITGLSYGITAIDAIEISGTVGDITGIGIVGDITTIIYTGIFAFTGGIEISGTVGNITGGDYGIRTLSGGDIEISGTVGNISGGDLGINPNNGNINISGTTGNITGGDYGIGAGGSIEISGTTGNISGDDYGIWVLLGSIKITAGASIGNNTANAIQGGIAQIGVGITDYNDFPRTTPKPWVWE